MNFIFTTGVAQPISVTPTDRRFIVASKGKKHRTLAHSTARQAGYEAPQPARKKEGGGYPSHQPFNANLRLKENKRVH